MELYQIMDIHRIFFAFKLPVIVSEIFFFLTQRNCSNWRYLVQIRIIISKSCVPVYDQSFDSRFEKKSLSFHLNGLSKLWSQIWEQVIGIIIIWKALGSNLNYHSKNLCGCVRSIFWSQIWEGIAQLSSEWLIKVVVSHLGASHWDCWCISSIWVQWHRKQIHLSKIRCI